MNKMKYILTVFLAISYLTMFGQQTRPLLGLEKPSRGQEIVFYRSDEEKKALAILGLSGNATNDQVRSAYKQLALKWHPDKWAGKSVAERKKAEEQFKKIKSAYEVFFPVGGGTPDEPEKEEPEEPEEPEEDDDKENLNYTKEALDKLLQKITEEDSGNTIGGVVKSIGKIVSTSLCKDRAFHVLPNIGEDGKMAPGFVLVTNKR